MTSVLVDGRWGEYGGAEDFESRDPLSGELLGRYPITAWGDIDHALDAGWRAYRALSGTPPETIGQFLNDYARALEGRADELVRVAHQETALPTAPRLVDVELPRTVDQLRQAAAAVVGRSWVEPTLTPAARIASWLAPLPGVVCVFSPNNFPFAFNSVAGGDFAAAIATHHPVIAKANPGHPATTRLLAEVAWEAVITAGLPPATVQMLYRTSHEDGRRMVADRRVAATAYTGSRAGGLSLKESADAAGKPIYLEMSSVNPVVLLPGAIAEDPDRIAAELASSLLLGCGQFCTSPGMIFVISSNATDRFLKALGDAVVDQPSGTLLSTEVAEGLDAARERWSAAGASTMRAGERGDTASSYPNTIMKVSGSGFVTEHDALQTEAFGNVSLVVEVEDVDELIACLAVVEGNLTGTIYAAVDGGDSGAYEATAPVLRERVGRLLHNRMPTGVAVVAAMNHGGPFPATGHPRFTAVGIPASLRRFATLQCFDNVPDDLLPEELRATNPRGLQRYVDGEWTRDEIWWGEPHHRS